MKSSYKILKTEEEIDTLIEYVRVTGYCSFDFETTGLEYYDETQYPTIIGISFQPGSSHIVPLGHFDSPFRDNYPRILRKLRVLFEDPRIVKVGWNLKFEYKWLRRYGIDLGGRVFDAMLLKYLLKEDRPHDLKSMVDMYLPDFAHYALPGSNSKNFNWEKVPLEPLSQYCGLDTDTTLRLFLWMERKVIDLGFYPLYRNMYCMLTRVLGKCEFFGIEVNREYLEELIHKYENLIRENEITLRNLKPIRKYERKRLKAIRKNMIEALEEEIEHYEDSGQMRQVASRKAKLNGILAGKYTTKKDSEQMAPLNFGSSKQMVDLLYESPYGFNLPILEYTEAGAPSSAEATLIKLKEYDNSGFIDLLLKSRELEKLNSTYVAGMLKSLSKDNRVHTSYKINGTVTSRLSSTEPNMQNIPRVTTNSDIKPMFIAPPGYAMVELDYSQAELRIVAELAKEEKMIEWFNRGHNIHVAVAVEAEKVNTGKDIKYEDIYPITKNESHPQHVEWTKKKKRAKCYSGDTEVLTVAGWIRLDEYSGQILAQYNFQEELITFTEPEQWGTVQSDKNYSYKDRNTDLFITHDHQTLFKTRAGKKIKTEFHELVGKNGYMPSAGKLANTQYKLTEDETRLLAMITADGSFRQGAIRFGFKRVGKVLRCRALLDKMGITYTLRELPKKGVTTFRIARLAYPQAINRYVGKSKDLSWNCLLEVPGDIYLQEAAHWDSHLDERWRDGSVNFTTTNEQTADVMQAMGTLNNCRIVKVTYKRGERTVYKISYKLSEFAYSRVNLKNAKLHVGEKTMYSVTVPERNLITRHNGKVTISGNTINFGILYEQSDAKLAETMKCTKDEAAKFKKEWLNTFPAIAKWIDRQHKKVKRDGYVVNIWGFKRRLPKIYSSKYGEMLEAQRQSVNAPIQGAASLFTLFSAIVIEEMRLKGEIPLDFPMVYTVHDSLGFYVKLDKIHEFAKIAIPIMANPQTKEWFGFQMKYVKMKASMELGLNWGSYRDYSPNEDYTK